MNHPKNIPDPIAKRLTQLRQRLTRWIWVKGLGTWLVLVLLMLAVDLLIDRLFKMDFAQRSIMLCVMLAAGAVSFYWYVVKPMLCRVTDDALLLEIEERFPALKENLISGAQLARQTDVEKSGVSKELVHVTIEKSIEFAKKMDFVGTINQSRYRKYLFTLLASVVCFVLLTAAVIQTGFFATWFNRNLMLGDAQWPQATYLQIVGAENGELAVPRGADYRLLVRVSEDSRIQDVEVTLKIQNDSSEVWHEMNPTGNINGREHSFLMHNVASEVTLTAMGGDATTEPVKLKMVEPPAISQLALRANYPAYTKKKPRNLAGAGPHSILEGSQIEIEANVNKKLREFELRTPQQNFALQPEKAGSLRYELQLPGENQKLMGGEYQFVLVDQNGLAAARPGKFNLTIKQDNSPKALASLLGIGSMVVPRARIPVSYNVTDDFGLSRICFLCGWKHSDTGEQAGQSGSDELPISDFSDFRKAVTKVEDVSVIELESFGLEPGASFKVLVRSADLVPEKPNIAESTENLVRIVSEEELRADLLRREIEQRKAFQQSYDRQLEISTELQAIAAMRPNGVDSNKFESDRDTRLLELSREQNLVGTNLDMIANRFLEYLVEANNNRLDEENSKFEGPKLTERFDEQIIKPIRKLDRDLISLASRDLDNCRRLLNRQNEFRSAVDAAGVLHQRILDEMKIIMSAMNDSENFQQAINSLLEIKRGEDQIKAELKRQKPISLEDELDEEDIFEDDE